MLKRNWLVLDLGASTGDFCILASKKVGNGGRVIAVEPNPRDYGLLLKNIELNHCENIVPLNVGIGAETDTATTTFRGQTFEFTVKTLQDILADAQIADAVDFIKMDIEGYEGQVVQKNVEKLSDAKVISIEFHGTKEIVDKILLPLGFIFYPVTMPYIYKKY